MTSLFTGRHVSHTRHILLLLLGLTVRTSYQLSKLRKSLFSLRVFGKRCVRCADLFGVSVFRQRYSYESLMRISVLKNLFTKIQIRLMNLNFITTDEIFMYSLRWYHLFRLKRCYIQQEMQLNGKRTEEEKMQDSGGIQCVMCLYNNARCYNYGSFL